MQLCFVLLAEWLYLRLTWLHWSRILAKLNLARVSSICLGVDDAVKMTEKTEVFVYEKAPGTCRLGKRTGWPCVLEVVGRLASQRWSFRSCLVWMCCPTVHLMILL